MLKNLFIALLAYIFLMACNSRDDHTGQFKELSKSLQKSTGIIREQNNATYAMLAYKLTEYQTQTRATIWQPKALQVQQLANHMRAYTEQFITQLEKGGAIDGLFIKKSSLLTGKLSAYKDSLMAVFTLAHFNDNAYIQSIVKKNVANFRNSYPFNDSSANFIKNMPASTALALLHKIANEVTVCENYMTAYCNEMVGNMGYDCIKYSAIATQNTSYFKAGDTIVITAGVGEFTTDLKSAITINGKPVSMEPYGYAEYSFKASKKPGKHRVPVTIKYMKPDGSAVSLTKNIIYEVTGTNE